MNKKIIILFSIIFSFFVLSCNNSSDAYTSASQIPKEVKESRGLSNYIGDWNVKFANNDSFVIKINSEDDIVYNNLKVSSIKDLGNDNYKITIEADKVFSSVLKFKSNEDGTIEDDNSVLGLYQKNNMLIFIFCYM